MHDKGRGDYRRTTSHVKFSCKKERASIQSNYTETSERHLKCISAHCIQQSIHRRHTGVLLISNAIHNHHYHSRRYDHDIVSRRLQGWKCLLSSLKLIISHGSVDPFQSTIEFPYLISPFNILPPSTARPTAPHSVTAIYTTGDTFHD